MEEVLKPSRIIGPLTFNNYNEFIVETSDSIFYSNHVCDCMLCDEVFKIPEEQQNMLTHLYMTHRLVIADLDQIAFLRDYILFWKQKFKCVELAEYCSTMILDKTPDGKFSKNEKYYLLSDVVPIDNQLRRDLQQKRLEKILNQQKNEREDKSYERECLFCRTTIKNSRSKFLDHLFEKHNFYVAKSENLVFISELIEVLSKKLEHCICTFCEKTFKDRNILKEHMRKKVHKRINPNNKEYDKYFISNYLEMGRNWQSYLKSVSSHSKSKKSNSSIHSGKSKGSKKESSSESDNDWSDWEEKDTSPIICLFCKHSENKYNEIVSHMMKEHQFDFDKIIKNMNFYEKIKVVNYIRRQVHLLHCITCDCQFTNNIQLTKHMQDAKHLILQNVKVWNQPEFYFPTYEDDELLFCLEDGDSDDEDKVIEKLQSIEIHSPNISEEVALSVLENE